MSQLPSLALIPKDNAALSDEITRLAGHINAAQHRFLTLLSSSARRGRATASNRQRTGSITTAALIWAPRVKKCASRRACNNFLALMTLFAPAPSATPKCAP